MHVIKVLTAVSIFYSTFILEKEAAIISINPICSYPREGKCIGIYQCPYFASLLKNSEKPKLQIIREIRNQQCGFMNKIPAVCCAEEKEDIIYGPSRQHKNLYLLPTDCGGIFTDFRITYGKRTYLNEYPWIALIVYDTENGLEFACGGTLINEKYVLTAAHCILKNIVGVRLGEYNVITQEDCLDENSYCAPPVQDFHIDKVIVHAEYNKLNNQNDIALIKLQNPANLSNENVRPICLPLETNLNLEGKVLTVTGWGMTETGYKSAILQKTTVPIIPLPVCQNIYKVHFSSNHICAGGERGDSCNGDSGGPLSLVVPIKQVARHVQHGIVSYGPKDCGTLGMPGIYTRVQGYIDWILDNLEP